MLDELCRRNAQSQLLLYCGCCGSILLCFVRGEEGAECELELNVREIALSIVYLPRSRREGVELERSLCQSVTSDPALRSR
ncbi:hypothetical protein BDY24DRAFT_419479 [Mrakia frigida]|uniref:uncharacterized protein n=1 Tax=Mrakia frigida TaxID=29902 RepID=UPI003FCC087A